MKSTARVAIIGLDCATPELLFDRFEDDMPNLARIRAGSTWGPLTSVVPPITVPAWSCMLSGRTPGELGVYGFRNRTGYGYDSLGIATSRSIKVPRLWQLVEEAGGESVTLGVPGTYPPSPVAGCLVSCFLAPSTEVDFTYPPSLRAELQALTGGYVLDVADFRSDDKAAIAQRIFDMTEQRFAVARHLATTRPWNLFSFVDMGPDRLHHGFWKYCDPAHPRHDPQNPHRHLFRDYYRALDRHLGQFVDALPPGTTILVVSDHGAQPMQGGFRINQWLVQQGLLVLTEQPADGSRLDPEKVDWPRTTAWAYGGYYARVHLNVRGREPQGAVTPARYEAVRGDLAALLEAMVDDHGRTMGTRAIRPEDVYPEAAGIPPDLIVYLGDLRWRALESFEPGGSLYSFDNDTGPDDANHAEQGVLVLTGDGVPAGRRDDLSIFGVMPTLCRMFGLPPIGSFPERRFF